tara:strand:+ start:345 stop:668 length:324 start_codon:yes stop_codon:yes gene_type:complete
LSVEIFIRSNYIDLISSLIKVSKKAKITILNKKISDHWKENIIPKYSLKMMHYSLRMLLVLLLIIFIFLITDKFSNGFILFTLSWRGMMESILLAFTYAYFRKKIFS